MQHDVNILHRLPCVKLFFVALHLPTLDELLDNWDTLKHTLNYVQQKALVEQLRPLAREMGKGPKVPEDPISFALKWPRYKWLDSPHLRHLSHEVSEAYWNCEALLAVMPPQHGKSTTCSAWLPFWALVEDPTLPILFISYEARFARKWGVRVRNLVSLYGEEYGLRLNPKQVAGDEWETTAGGGMQTTGAGGPIPGKTAKLLIVDDPIKEDDARSSLMRDQIWEWWETTVMARAAADTTIIVIGTLWHEDDLLSRLIKAAAEGTGIAFKVLRLPAAAEEEDPLDRAEGEGLWITHPRFPQDWYERRQQSVSPHVWTTVYQCRATPREGTLVDPAWWQFYKPSQVPPKFDQEVQTWDLALDSTKKSHSYQCGLILGRDQGLIYVRDIFREHCGIIKVADAARAWSVLYPAARAKLVERKASGPAFIQTLHRQLPGLIPWPPEGRRMGSKEARLDAIIPYIRSGNIRLPINEDGTRPKWVQELIEEFRQFPSGTHDDQIDALGQGVLFMLPLAWRATDEAAAFADAMSPQTTPLEHHTETLHGLLHERARSTVAALGGPRRLTPESIRSMADRPHALPFQKKVGGLRKGW